MIKNIMIGAMLAGFSATGFAQNSQPVLTSVSFHKVFTPVGFDDNDSVEIVGDGFFPNSCYKVGPTHAKVDHNTKRIYLETSALKYDGMCLEVIVPFSTVISLGTLEQGNYQVIQDQRVVANIPVNRSKTANADDYLYAPVTQAYLDKTPNGQHYIALSGEFMNNCMVYKDTIVNIEKDTIIIQPIAELTGKSDCQRKIIPFKKIIPLKQKLPSARYLLHVRSMNGRSINTVFGI